MCILDRQPRGQKMPSLRDFCDVFLIQNSRYVTADHLIHKVCAVSTTIKISKYPQINNTFHLSNKEVGTMFLNGASGAKTAMRAYPST